MKSSARSFLLFVSAVCLLLGQSIYPQEQDERKLTGTAFVVSPDGYLLTCEHVVADAAKVEVAIGGKNYEATVLAVDSKAGLALLQIKAKGLTALPLADSNAVEVGEEVRAFGFPLASVLGDSVKVTRGTVSGIETKKGQKVFQIDAAINPGNSGGPLTNERGEVIGVIDAKLYGTAVSSVAFSIPMNGTKLLLKEKNVGFSSSGTKRQLTGPALVRQIAPAIALVTNTRKDPFASSPELIRSLTRVAHYNVSPVTLCFPPTAKISHAR